MASEIFGPILPLQLDSRNVNDIVRAIQSRIHIESGGRLTDFTPASPLAAISEGHGFAQAELLYYLNSLPEAVTLQWLRGLGIQRRIGSRAKVDVTFFKIPGYSRPVTIPAGTRVYANGGQTYLLLDQVSIVGESAIATAQSERWGTVYNVEPGAIAKIEKNFLGLESLTNVDSAAGGTDLETVDEMKLRAFELFGRRNLTSRNDFESEIKRLAPEASIVKAMSYEERFGENSRGIFLVAGEDTGKALSATSQSQILSSLRDRIPLDVSIYLATPDVVPVEAVISIVWDPVATTTFTDTLALEVKNTIAEYISPQTLGLGQDLSSSEVLRQILNLEFVREVTILDLKQMIVNPNPVSGVDGPCGRLVGDESDDELTCLYQYSQMVSRESTSPLECPSTTSVFRLQRAIISLISRVDFSALTYTYEGLYAIQ